MSDGGPASDPYLTQLEPQIRTGHPHGWLRLERRPVDVDDVVRAWSEALHRPSVRRPRPPSVYVHFPFCPQSCHFCQYWHTVPRKLDEMARYVDYLSSTFERYRRKLGRVNVCAAYFGGGTPTSLTTPLWRQFFTSFSTTFDVQGEFTCEAHPGTVNAAKLKVLAESGVNRISMGVQSFDAEVLTSINRLNRPLRRLAWVVRTSQELGMEVNLDLVLGLPHQTAESAQQDLDAVLSLKPEQITLYRYRPTTRLPVDIDPALMLPQFARTVRRRALTHRYLAVPPFPSSATSSIALHRILRRRAVPWRQRTEKALNSFIVGREHTPVYWPPFDAPRANVLGFGLTSVSHLYGFGWYEDATELASVGADVKPAYRATRMTATDEMHRMFLAGMSKIPSSVFARSPLLQRAIGARRDRIVAAAVSRWVGESSDQALSEASVEVPRTGPPPEPAKAIEREHVTAPETPSLPAVTTVQGRDVEATNLWRAAAGVSASGDCFQNGRLEELREDELVFRVAPSPAPTLTLRVRWRGTGPHFVQGQVLEYAYAERPSNPVTAEEMGFLRACARVFIPAEAVAGRAGLPAERREP